LEICYLESIASTQLFLENAIKNGKLEAPICVWTLDQTNGVGSRENDWLGLKGNLAFSFALPLETLPSDLPPQSASLYYGYLFKETIAFLGSRLWLKWPNDLYMGEKKIGGVITKRFGGVAIVGIGLNIVAPDSIFGSLDIAVDPASALAIFLEEVEKKRSWNDIFSGYRLEYPLSQACRVHSELGDFSLKDAVLEADGSVRIGQERVFSQR
jgi:BirA family biotin operon repressor/biotin-[acetyl-CoA-carboxylase] ligase